MASLHTLKERLMFRTHFRNGLHMFQFLLFFLVSVFSAPKEVHLGGLFAFYRMSGEAIPSGQQRLAVFLMAVKEINNSTSILPQTKIKVSVKDTKYDVGETFFSTLELAASSFSGKGVDACIGAATSVESDVAATVFSKFSTVLISYAATSPLLSTKINSPYFARTCPSDSFQGAAMANLVAKYYGWRKVATFANSDTYGSSGISQFQSSAITLGVQIISSSLFPQGQSDFAGPIAEAKASGARIFIFFMSAKDMGNLLVQGYAAGLFGEGTQIIASDAAAVDFWAGIPKGQVATMMKGLIVFTPSAGFSTPKGKKFLDTFIHQENTVKDPVTGLCNNTTDDDGNYLLKGKISSDPSETSCSGLNYTKFHLDGSNIDSFVSYTYDAVYAIARAMHVVLYDQKKPSITGKDLYAALINNVSFSGATGAVDFSNATTTDSTRYGEGDRRTGITYTILNFSPEVYRMDPSGISGFVTVGGWTIEEGNVFTADVTYNTIDNSKPSDLPPAIILTMLPLQATILKCFGTILLLIASIFGLTLFYARSTKLVKSIHYKMQCIMIFGALCGAARVFFGTTKVTDVNCSACMWLSHLAFWMMFAPMMLKTWRVYRIVNNKTLKYVTVTESSILRIFGIILLFIVAYLSILQSLSVTTPIKITVQSQDGIQPYLDDQCSRAGKDSEMYLFILEGLLLLLTGVLCYMTKDISGALNEARNNFTAIVLVSLTIIISFPLIFNLPNITEGTRQFICSTSTFLSVFCTLCCLHGTRSVFLLLNYDIDVDHQFSKRINSVSPVNSATISTLEASVDEAQPSVEDMFGGSERNPFEAVQSRNLDYRRQVCKQQIAHWSKKHNHTEAMMLVADDEAVTPVFMFRKRATLNSIASSFPLESSMFSDQGFYVPDALNGTTEEVLLTGTHPVALDNLESFSRFEANDLDSPLTPASTDVD